MDNQTDISTVEHSGSELQDFRFLKPLTKDDAPELIQEVWEKLRTQDYAFDDFSRNNPGMFLFGLAAETNKYFLIEDVGLVILQDIWENSIPSIHFCVWDRNYPFQKLKEAARELFDWLFKTYNCHRINALIPDYNKFAERLAHVLRFHYEGSMKEAILFKGKWFDQKMFGLLQSAYFKHEVN